MMNIKKLSEILEKTQSMLDAPLQQPVKDDQILIFFEKADSLRLLANTSIIQKMIDYFQLLNEKVNYESIQLEEIMDIYLKLIKINPLDVSLYESAFYCMDTVMDKPEEARKIIKLGIDQAENKLNELKQLY